MEIAEIRDLDGPNLFMLRPAIKLEIDTGGTPMAAEAFAAHVAIGDPLEEPTMVPVTVERLQSLLAEVVNVLHDRVGSPRPQIETRVMEAPNHVTVAFSWTNRPFAKRLAQVAYDIVTGSIADLPAAIDELARLSSAHLTPAQQPDMLADADRRVPVIGVTGTNGKTTTTRLISSILMESGKRVGWTSSSGVVVQGETVLEGDFTGPAGAARVFEEPDLDVAVLETARGGILLRGLGYESNDVSVVTNISADHLGLQGVYTVDGLAEVKQVVAAVTKTDGFAVLNAGDSLVLAMRDAIRARPFLIAREASNAAVLEHRQAGGWALWVESGLVQFAHDGVEEVLTDLNDIPIAFGGKAPHMLENALCAAAATLAIGLEVDQVRTGLARFRNQSDQNRGRLNVFDVEGVRVIIDFAHNVAGLKHLLALGRGLTSSDRRLVAAVGSAGDRPDDSLMELGRLASEEADTVIIKDTVKYLRGRSTGDIPRLILKGIDDTRHREIQVVPNELAAFELALTLVSLGDTVVIMCIEDVDYILDRLNDIGTPMS